MADGGLYYDHRGKLTRDKSGTPALTPGVLEDGGSARVGDLTPPGLDVGPTADPPSLPLTDEMRVERCRALLDQWRKERLGYPVEQHVGSAMYIAVKACEDELREALGDQT
jgi:hypothetical protein